MKKYFSFVLALLLAIPLSAENLSEVAAKYGFKLGTAMGYNQLLDKDYCKMITNDFNSLTATNEFKAYSLVNMGKSRKNPDGMPVMSYEKADAIMEFAKENNIKIRGHVLVWDAYMPDWFFRTGYSKAGNLVDSDTMKLRLEYYINDVISHFETKYPGIIYCWDVVNEAVADSPNEANPGDNRRVRKTRGGAKNMFYEVIGPDYVEFSFKCAKEAVKKTGSDIKLFYNDYNTFFQDKRNCIINLISSINKDEKLCDGVGMQGYIGGYGHQNGCMNNNDINNVKTSILAYSKLGIEVQITEMAVRNYENSDSVKRRHAEFYESLFLTLKEINNIKPGALTCVAIWGIKDEPGLDKNNYSYKMNGPYCGMFDENCAPKDDYYRVLNALK